MQSTQHLNHFALRQAADLCGLTGWITCRTVSLSYILITEPATCRSLLVRQMGDRCIPVGHSLDTEAVTATLAPVEAIAHPS